MESDFQDLESLLAEWEAGTLDEIGIERVRDILRSDERAREYYVRTQMIAAALHMEGDAGLGMPPIEGLTQCNSESEIQPQRARAGWTASGFRYWIAAAAALAICSLVGRLAYLEFAGKRQATTGIARTQSSDETTEATAQGVALVTSLVDVEWATGEATVQVGEALPPGPFMFEAGLAQIEFFCGATVIVEGPADLELISPMLARVRGGRIRAQVPPAARGFALEASDMKVVDLGTEFGLSVSPEGASVQVFDGEVEVHHRVDKKQRLTTGQAIARSRDGSYRAVPTTPSEFVDIATLEQRASVQRKARYDRWKQWSDRIRTDSRLIAYYSFDRKGHWHRRLTNEAAPENSELDGAIVGAKRSAGRWPRKSSLEFKQPGDRVRVSIPGEFGSLTFACWLKIDSLDRRFNSLFLTDGYDEGEPHWQILDTGQLSFSRRIAENSVIPTEERSTLSPPFWKPAMSGKWIHLASAFDHDTRVVTHYLNGQQLSQTTVSMRMAAATTRIGPASIANWALPRGRDSVQAIRNLNGSIDEFAIFSVALSGEEIRGMYEHGKP